MEHLPTSGSCARCRAALGLASVKSQGQWYCSPGCANGEVQVSHRVPAVPETWLYSRPQRFFGARKPKELNTVAV